MHKIDVDGGSKTLAEIKDLKEIAYNGLIATGPSYEGVCSDRGIRVRSIKGKSVQNVGGGVTPSPDNSVEIESFSQKVIFSAGKNLCDQASLQTGALHETTGEEVISTTTKRSGIIPVKGNALYSITAFTKRIFFYEGNAHIRNAVFSENTFQTPAGCTSIRFHFASANYSGDIMLNEGNSLSPYEPFCGGTVSKEITLRSLPDGTKDEYKDGKIIRRVGAKTFDGSSDEGWSKRADNTGYAIPIADAKIVSVGSEVLCSHGKFINANDRSKGSIVLGGNRTISYYMGGESLDTPTFRQWLASNPMTVLYPLNEPTEESVSIPILPTKAPYVQAYTDSPVDTEIEWEILTKSDYASDIADIKERLAALESAALE